MNLYKTTATNESGQKDVSFQGSQTEASKARSAAKKDGCKAESQTINVPTSKDGLLEWLNANAV
jgi:hypothetical protein